MVDEVELGLAGVAVADAQALVVLPCSNDKAVGGVPRDARDPSIVDVLPDEIADELVWARRRTAVRAAVDERAVLPALERYSGTLFRALGDEARGALRRRRVVLVSGGYGLVEAGEPVGSYERLLRLGDWPDGLLSRALAAYAAMCRVSEVVGFAGASSPFASVLRRVDWPDTVERAWLVSPYEVNGAAMVKTPRALGEALNTACTGFLDVGWRSTHGVPVAADRLR